MDCSMKAFWETFKIHSLMRHPYILAPRSPHSDLSNPVEISIVGRIPNTAIGRLLDFPDSLFVFNKQPLF